MKLPLLEAPSAILAHMEEKYLVPGLHVDFVKKEQTAQLDGSFTRDGLRGMIE